MTLTLYSDAENSWRRSVGASAFTDRVDPDAPVRVGERSSPEIAGPRKPRRSLAPLADEGVRPYVCSLVEFTCR